MLDRDVVEEFLDCKLKEIEIEIPKDNFKSFFGDGEPDWEWIKGKIKATDST